MPGIENIAPAIRDILDLARWAPSGDNTQPWRFELVSPEHLVVHGFDTRDGCVYDLTGHPSQISLGALLENIVIAASKHKLSVSISRRNNTPETNPTFDVRFRRDDALAPNPLISSIRVRSVQRRAFSTRPLTTSEKASLRYSLGADHDVIWLEGFASRVKAARLMFANAKLRLTMPEAYQVHRQIIHWNAQFSEDRVPDQALGLDSFTVRLMRWAMQSWNRVNFLNTYLAGTVAPRIQMDMIPSMACAAHFVILARQPAADIDDYVVAGRAMQRFWLTATELGLQIQPEMTPLIFASYVRARIPFSQALGMREKAEHLLQRLEELLGSEQSRLAVFMGRIGAGHAAKARSVRLHAAIGVFPHPTVT